MKFKKQRDEEERLERAAKIHAHLSKGTTKAEPKAKPGATKTETQAETTADQPVQTPAIPQPVPCLLIPPLRPWEKAGAFGRREQFRPMTPREAEAENDRIFMESQVRQDRVHAAKVAAAEREAKEQQATAKQRAEKEARTGKRPYEPGRYISLEEARSRGYLETPGGDSRPSESNPQGLFCGGGNGRRR